jgi:hypothetical protein
VARGTAKNTEKIGFWAKNIIVNEKFQKSSFLFLAMEMSEKMLFGGEFIRDNAAL